MTESTTIHQQLVDAVTQVASAAATDPQPGGISDQLVSLTLSLAMQNAVAQQQQLYMLQNAATAALVRTLLESGPSAAAAWGEALEIVNRTFSGVDIAGTLDQLTDLIHRHNAAIRSSKPASDSDTRPARSDDAGSAAATGS